MVSPRLFAADTIHEREITFSDGTTEKLYFKQVSSAEMEKLRGAKTGLEADFLAVSKVIARCVCEPDGSTAMTVEQAGQIVPGVRAAISRAISDVNEIAASVGKVLPPEEKTTSGESSSLTA
jgi:hypothetical protein